VTVIDVRHQLLELARHEPAHAELLMRAAHEIDTCRARLASVQRQLLDLAATAEPWRATNAKPTQES
jgi:hypothetical protein